MFYLSLPILFKIYFIGSLIFFLFTYTERYKFLEKLSMATLVAGLFFILSFNSTLITFSAFSLVIISTYGFILTRIRPNKETISVIAISLILSLLYNVNPSLSLIMLILISCCFCLRANNQAIEALIIFFIIPILTYLSLNYLIVKRVDLVFTSLLRIFGLSLIILSALIVISKKMPDKKMITYVFFYFGHILFTISLNTPESYSLAIILLFLMPFIYSPSPSIVSLFNMAMLPLSPTFLIKITILLVAVRNKSFIDAGLILISSLIMLAYCTADLGNLMLELKSTKTRVPTTLKTISVALVLLCLIYLDTVKNVIKITVGAISG